jgi:hypothetical protein
VKFPKDNKIVYGQDFGWYKGVPSDVDFEVEGIIQNRINLVADGYGRLGGNKYGNGSICVYLKEDFKPEIKPQDNNQKIIKKLQECLKLLEATND